MSANYSHSFFGILESGIRRPFFYVGDTDMKFTGLWFIARGFHDAWSEHDLISPSGALIDQEFLKYLRDKLGLEDHQWTFHDSILTNCGGDQANAMDTLEAYLKEFRQNFPTLFED